MLTDFSKQLLIETNASIFILGVALTQKGHSIAFFSKTSGKRASMKPIYEKELMAIVFAILKWRHYLLGRKFIVRTDQSRLKFLLEQQEVGVEYQNWLTKIIGFDFEIRYNPRASNKVCMTPYQINNDTVFFWEPFVAPMK